MATDPDETTLPAARRRGGHKIESASQSDVGRSRTENQDACGEFEDDAGNRLLVVADGMGGHQGGATASRICVESLGRVFTSSNDPLEVRLQRGLEHANEQVFQTAEQDPSLEGMGTTAVALAFTPAGDAYVAWVGDSRAYRFREGRLERLSDDHSLVAEWVRLGVISEDEAESHPRKNELLRSIGVRAGVEVDVRAVEVLPGDRYLLCSDGLCGEVPDPEIAAVLGFVEPEAATQQLIDKANARGGPDNITVQIAAVADAPRAASGAAKPTFPHPVRDRRPLIGRLVVAVATVAVVLVGLGWYAITRSGGESPPDVPEPPMRSRPFAPEAPLAEASRAETSRVREPRGRPSAGSARTESPRTEPADAERSPTAGRGAIQTPPTPPRSGAETTAELRGEPATTGGPGPSAARPPTASSPSATEARSAAEPPSRAGEPVATVTPPPSPTPQAPTRAPPEPPEPQATSLAASRPAAGGGAATSPAPPAPSAARLASPQPPAPEPPVPERAAPEPPVEVARADPEAPSGSAPAPAGTATVDPIEGEIQSFLESWSRSVETKDYALYASLELPSTQQKFERLYGEKEGVELDFELIEYTRPSQGVLNLRLQMTYSHQDVGLARRINRERKVQVRETTEGLRYVGGWE